MMGKDLTYYRLVPYEREWAVREDAGQRYFVVRLKDIPAVAGDGATRDEAVEDLRGAFDEFVLAWLESGSTIPQPSRAFSVPFASTQPLVEESSAGRWCAPDGTTGRANWAEEAVVYKGVQVEETSTGPCMKTMVSAAR
jgi:predicted RNase H-like HicB family nuclease